MSTRLLVAPSLDRVADVCGPTTRDLLKQRFDVTRNDGPELSLSQLAAMLGGGEVLRTSWSSPSLSSEVLAANPELRMVGARAVDSSGTICLSAQYTDPYLDTQAQVSADLLYAREIFG